MKLNKEERKRQQHIHELITTEQAYIEDMTAVHEVWLFKMFIILCSGYFIVCADLIFSVNIYFFLIFIICEFEITIFL